MNFKALQKHQFWIYVCHGCNRTTDKLYTEDYTIAAAAERFYLDGWISEGTKALCPVCQKTLPGDPK